MNIDTNKLLDTELFVVFCSWYKNVEGRFPYWIKPSDREIMEQWIEIEMHPDVREQRVLEETKRKKYQNDRELLILDETHYENSMKELVAEYE